MSVMASQITSLTIVYSTTHSGADQRNHQSSVSLAFENDNDNGNEKNFIAKQHWSHIQTYMKIQVQGITWHMRKMITWQRLEAKAYAPQYLLHRLIIWTGCRTNSAGCRLYPRQYWCITRFRIIVQRVFIDNGGKSICHFLIRLR